MTRKGLLSVLDIARELNAGKATTKFILKRFKKWLPFDLIDGQAFYSGAIMKPLFLIQENLDMGVLPSDIEKKLDQTCEADPDKGFSPLSNSSNSKGIYMEKETLNLLKSLLIEIGDQQKRIVSAHEKRAEVEERKAAAIEKTAVAEEKKAEAMNNIAKALQDMNTIGAGDHAVQQINHKAAAILAADAVMEDELIQDKTIQDDISPELDNLSALIQDDRNDDEKEGLSSPVDPIQTGDPNSPEDQAGVDQNQADRKQPNKKQPDKSSSDKNQSDPHLTDQGTELDDLSALIDEDEAEDGVKTETQDPMVMDDLSKLIESSPDLDLQDNDMDDLSQLIEEESVSQNQENPLVQMDDLSRLIDEPDTGAPEDTDGPDTDNQGTLEEAAAVDNEPENVPEVKIDISPEKDIKKYKAAVMKIIIDLKKDGLSAEAAAIYLNKNKIKTLSGKPEWSLKAISQIYTFIASAA